MDQKKLTYGHEKNDAGFLIKIREVRKQEERNCFSSVVREAESDIFTDLCIQIRHYFKQHNQKPVHNIALERSIIRNVPRAKWLFH